MNKLNKFFVFLISVFFIGATNLFAEKTSVENLHQFNLENGLTVFVAEDHAVPLVYIEIAVKTGAKSQTPESAGLFHLYEHMMFKGNALYKDAASVQRALSELGVTNWNGTTGVDCVNYYFTIPSDRLEDGLAFWNAAVRTPNMNRLEFENEKKVVLSEIEGDIADPSHIYLNNSYNLLFPEAPYRLSAGGSTPVIKNATVAQLLDIKDKFYIPSNSALFIGGDINPEETNQLVEKIFGTWSNNGKEIPAPQKQLNKNPLSKPVAMVMPYDQISPQTASVSLMFRGPDTDYDLEDTYAADYFCQLTDDPECALLQNLFADNELQIPGREYIWQGYQTVCQSGMIQFGATVMNPTNNLAKRAMKFYQDLQDNILKDVALDSNLFNEKKIKIIAQSLEDQNAIINSTATGLLTNLRFWWIATSPEYYYSYNEKIASVTQQDMIDFVNEYIYKKNALITVLVNPQIYNQIKNELDDAGFIVADMTKAAWWNDEKFKADSTKIAEINKLYGNKKQNPVEIYRPEPVEERSSKEIKSISEGLEELKLKNGIKVYFKKDDSKRIATVQIASRGGVSHLTPETSGLEEALFYFMCNSSKNYDFTARQILQFETKSTITSSCSTSGSVISLNVLDSYFDENLLALTDGFMNPEFDESFYAKLMTDYGNQMQQTLNDPGSLLSYTAVKDVFKNHPYETCSYVTIDSINNITIQNLKNLHRFLMDPSKIFITAVGNIDKEKLISTLNKTLGNLRLMTFTALPEKNIPQVKIENDEPLILTHESCAGTGYVLRLFPAAPNTNIEEYIPSGIAADIYSDLLFTVVRESHGICYTPSSYIISSKAPIGVEFLINLSNFADFTYAMDTARSLMGYGMVVSGTNVGGSYSFEPLENVLESYKNKYINSTYSNQATPESTASALTWSILNYNDVKNYDKQIQQIRLTTAKEIKDVFKKYWIDSASKWFVITGPDDAEKLEFKK